MHSKELSQPWWFWWLYSCTSWEQMLKFIVPLSTSTMFKPWQEFFVKNCSIKATNVNIKSIYPFLSHPTTGNHAWPDQAKRQTEQLNIPCTNVTFWVALVIRSLALDFLPQELVLFSWCTRIPRANVQAADDDCACRSSSRQWTPGLCRRCRRERAGNSVYCCTPGTDPTGFHNTRILQQIQTLSTFPFVVSWCFFTESKETQITHCWWCRRWPWSRICHQTQTASLWNIRQDTSRCTCESLPSAGTHSGRHSGTKRAI